MNINSLKDKQNTKILIRKQFLQIRKKLPATRRQQASKDLLAYISSIPKEAKVLSFSSIGSEIDTLLANLFLLERSQLFFPKHSKDNRLLVVRVSKSTDLTSISSLSKIPSNPIVSGHTITHILVPGIAFDIWGTRIGYGLGCYDRLLAQFPELISWGVCFKEQLSYEKLPNESHDVSVNNVLCF
ncbi:5-formyltetrahydrofolate cyclo-ligase [Chlamydiifrater volucris]|uniref:5-formyltetrahydrofolate cyclo-ligase n=1 Tax=Chlamydiifrater volucris TaxID=2681470 RepID=UPI001BCD4E2B|nr:5-formyltetrahydrofolate cyclo-ligase [Chlamydiifrater volucris]